MLASIPEFPAAVFSVLLTISPRPFCRQGAAANPDSEEQQQKLREAAEGLRIATNAAAQNAIKKRLVNKLEVEEPEHLHTPQGTGRPARGPAAG